MSNTQKLTSGATPTQIADDLAPLLDFQAEGLPPDELKAMISNRLVPHLMRYESPRFQSMFNMTPPPEAKLGAQVMLDYNQGVTNWQVSPGGAMLEELCVQALCRLFGLGPDADATFMLAGTLANQQAVYLALHRHAERQGFDFAQQGIAGFDAPERLAVVVSEDTHFSFKHAARTVGLGENCLLTVPVDARRRMDVNQLRQRLAEWQKTRDIFCIVATAGSTSTGAVDPLDALADACAATGAWLHVDGAYGYAYSLVPEWSHLFKGHPRADSITWDPHKQLGTPIPNSVLFVREKTSFDRMALHSSYFNRAEDVEPNPGLKSIPSTRPMAALPLITILRGQGLDQVIKTLRAPLAAIRALADALQDQPDIELCHQPDTGVLAFRMTPAGTAPEQLDALQRNLYQKVMASGQRSISMTTLGHKTVLRLTTVSPHTTVDDLLETIAMLRRFIQTERNQNATH